MGKEGQWGGEERGEPCLTPPCLQLPAARGAQGGCPGLLWVQCSLMAAGGVLRAAAFGGIGRNINFRWEE